MLGLLLALAAQAAVPPGWGGGSVPPGKTNWPTREQDVVLKDFRFGDGEALPELIAAASQFALAGEADVGNDDVELAGLNPKVRAVDAHLD